MSNSVIPEMISHYRLLNKLGAGGMGDVYLAEDLRLNRKVAIKLLLPDPIADNRAATRLIREAQAAAKLDHPNICAIHEVGEDAGRPFIVLQYVDGETLADRIRRGPLTSSQVLDLAAQIADALADAHGHGLVHRDIKPQNIMVTASGNVKVLDFGLAKVMQEGGIVNLNATTAYEVTEVGVIVGTAPYMSPDQINGQVLDGRSDLFSLGVVLYEMITGRKPFAGVTPAATISAILSQEPQALARYSADAPPELQRIVRKCLEKDRVRRYQSASELLIDLNNLKRARDSAMETTLGIAPHSEPRRRRQHRTSLAILPLVNGSNDPNMEYLSDGVTESIINNLSQIPALKVMARSAVFQYKGQGVDPQQVGRALDVRAVLSGRLVQLGDNLIFSVELVNTRDGSQVWGEHYKRKLSDIFEVQNQIAKEISEKLRLKVTGKQQKKLAKRHTSSVEAYQLYLRGRHFWYKRTEEALRKGIDCFNQALEHDPSYAAAYNGLSDSYALLALRGVIPAREAFVRAKAASRKALEIDPALAEAYASLAHVRLHDWDWAGLDNEFKRALELNPGYSFAYHWYSEYLMAMGKLDESITIMKQGGELDPLSPIITATVGSAYFFACKYDEAIEQFHAGLGINSNHFLLHLRLAHAYSRKGMCGKAIEEARTAVTLSGGSVETLAGLGQAYAAAGMRSEMQEVLDQLEEQAKERYVSAYYVAKIHAALGDKEQAFAWLEKAYEERNPDLIELKVEPALDCLHSDHRFTDLLSRIGL